MNKIIWLLLIFPLSLSAQVTPESLYNDNLAVLSPSSIELSWSIPTARQNGDALPVSELSGYQIYYTAVLDNAPLPVSGIVDVDGGAITKASIPIAGSGVYSFAIAAIDTDELKSELSDTINATTLGKNPPGKIPGMTVTVVCGDGSVCNFYLGTQ